MPPSVIRSLGATAPSLPIALAGMMCGTANVLAAAADCRKRRRVKACDIALLPLARGSETSEPGATGKREAKFTISMSNRSSENKSVRRGVMSANADLPVRCRTRTTRTTVCRPRGARALSSLAPTDGLRRTRAGFHKCQQARRPRLDPVAMPASSWPLIKPDLVLDCDGNGRTPDRRHGRCAVVVLRAQRYSLDSIGCAHRCFEKSRDCCGERFVMSAQTRAKFEAEKRSYAPSIGQHRSAVLSPANCSRAMCPARLRRLGIPVPNVTTQVNEP